ncbi:MAG: hypothetical protein HY078_12840 [Elusimicrobia bacterium]|nr:hypothetical protein [Elusimicrobiota bacterium]
MDSLLKIRLAIWVMVLALWGTLVYQYLGDDFSAPIHQMHWVGNPFKSAALPIPSIDDLNPSEPPDPTLPAATPEKSPPPAATDDLAKSMPTTPLPAPWEAAGPDKVKTPATAKARDEEKAAAPKLATAPPPGRFISPIKPRAATPKTPPRKKTSTSGSLRRHEYVEPSQETQPEATRPAQAPSPPEPRTPTGFVKTQTQHFLIFSEGTAAPGAFVQAVENLHANLMIDLAAFSPWASGERVSIFLFRNQDSYRRVTGRPAWSGGASSVSKRKIYLYESDELMGILAHEMCHIFFDSFFMGGANDPLWLSEGMATLVQVERGLSSPNWLPENLDILSRGGGFKIDDLMRIENTSGANDDNVRLWYTQSYSIVRFLLRTQVRSAFLRFCNYLRQGVPVQAALYRAYGAPYNRVKALETAWRFDMETRSISRLRNSR